MRKIVVILAGLPGTGKSSAGKFFADLNVPVIRMGNLTNKQLKNQKLAQTELNESAIRKDLRKKFGKDIYAREVLPEVNQLLQEFNLVAIDGMRSLDEWAYFKKNINAPEIIYLESDKRHREERLAKRFPRRLTPKEVKLREDYETKVLKINQLKPEARFIIINNTNKENFYNLLEKAINQIKID